MTQPRAHRRGRWLTGLDHISVKQQLDVHVDRLQNATSTTSSPQSARSLAWDRGSLGAGCWVLGGESHQKDTCSQARFSALKPHSNSKKWRCGRGIGTKLGRADL